MHGTTKETTDRVRVMNTQLGKGVFTTCPVPAGDTILVFERNFVTKPTTITLRVDADKHQLSSDPLAAENFINHSCQPTTYIDFDALTLRAVRNLSQNEELTYNYLTSDFDGEDPFTCRCRAPNCHGTINGFKHLSLDQKKKLEPFLSPYLRKKLHEEIALP